MEAWQCFEGRGFAMVPLYNGEGCWARDVGLMTIDLQRIELLVITLLPLGREAV